MGIFLKGIGESPEPIAVDPSKLRKPIGESRPEVIDPQKLQKSIDAIIPNQNTQNKLKGLGTDFQRVDGALAIKHSLTARGTDINFNGIQLSVGSAFYFRLGDTITEQSDTGIIRDREGNSFQSITLTVMTDSGDTQTLIVTRKRDPLVK